MKQLIVRILTAQARRFIRKNNPKIVAVVGSIGKTSTAQAIATVLREQFTVTATIKSYNTDIGVPCTIFQKSLPDRLGDPFAWIKIIVSNELTLLSKQNVDVLVLELGTDRPGDLNIFRWLPIDLCIVTAIADEHMEYFQTLDAVAKEELSVANFSKKLLLNKRMVDQKYLADINHADINYYDRDDLAAIGLGLDNLQVIAAHSCDAVSAAVMSGRILGMDEDKLRTGAMAIKPESGRMSKLAGIKGSTLIDDTYNSSPKAVFAALDYLYGVSAPQKIVLLGNMNELGATSEQSHVAIGDYCDPTQLSLVVTLGPDANQFTAKAAQAKGCQVQMATTPYEAAKIIETAMQPGAYVLLKGSQNRVFAEETVKRLLADVADSANIVRQSKFWMSKKKECFGDTDV